MICPTGISKNSFTKKTQKEKKYTRPGGICSLKNLESLRQATHDKSLRLTRLAEKLIYTQEGNESVETNDVQAIKFGLVNVRQFQVIKSLRFFMFLILCLQTKYIIK